MANQKISQLPTITGANMEDDDKFVLVDTSGDATVATTREEFFKNVPDVEWGDNQKAIFGAGSDLQIYHDGSNNYVDASGVGHLYLRSQGDDKDVKIQSDDGSGGLTEYFRADGSLGQAQMYYYGAKKLNTTSTGIDVTGTVTADGLTVDGDVVISNPTASQSYLRIEGQSGNVADVNFAGIEFYNVDPSGKGPNVAAFIEAQAQDSIGQAGQLVLATAPIGSTPEGERAIQRMRINSAGDISFYEDTGTTPKFFWDSSAESLGIGTSSPSAPLTLSVSGASSAFATFNSGNTADITSYSARAALELISYQSDNGGPYTKTSAIIANGDGTVPSEMQFWTKTNGQSSPAERMRIDSSGQVGIGTDDPDSVPFS